MRERVGGKGRGVERVVLDRWRERNKYVERERE